MMKEQLFLKRKPTLKPSIFGKTAIHAPVIIESPGRPKMMRGSCKRLGGRIKTIKQLKSIPSHDSPGNSQKRPADRDSYEPHRGRIGWGARPPRAQPTTPSSLASSWCA